MKRATALIASAGILLGGCEYGTNTDAIRESVGKRPTAIEILRSHIDTEIVPRLGAAGLILILGQQDESMESVKLVVTRDSYCASTFSFSRDTLQNSGQVRLGLDLFGNFLDLIDERQLNGSAMYDGTIGHGDNVITEPAAYIPGNPVSIGRALEFMKDGTDEACSSLREPPAINTQ